VRRGGAREPAPRSTTARKQNDVPNGPPNRKIGGSFSMLHGLGVENSGARRPDVHVREF
jgi:hypothetical protein